MYRMIGVKFAPLDYDRVRAYVTEAPGRQLSRMVRLAVLEYIQARAPHLFTADPLAAFQALRASAGRAGEVVAGDQAGDPAPIGDQAGKARPKSRKGGAGTFTPAGARDNLRRRKGKDKPAPARKPVKESPARPRKKGAKS